MTGTLRPGAAPGRGSRVAGGGRAVLEVDRAGAGRQRRDGRAGDGGGVGRDYVVAGGDVVGARA